MKYPKSLKALIFLMVLCALLISPVSSDAQDNGQNANTPSSSSVRKLRLKHGFWVAPQKTEIDGILRASFQIGSHPDFSFIFRATFPDEITEVSGYGVSIEGPHIQIHRWENGFPAPVTVKYRMSHLPSRIEIVVKMKGFHFETTVFDSGTRMPIISLESEDSTYFGKDIGYRVFHKQDSGTGMVSWSYTPDKEQTDHKELPIIQSPDAYLKHHPSVYVIVPNDAQPPHDCHHVENGNIEKHEVYRCNHDVMKTLVDKKGFLPEGWFWAEPRNSFMDAEYRMTAKDLACEKPMHCVPSKPLDPNRSAKDVTMIQAYIDRYGEVCTKHIKYVRIEEIGQTWMGHKIRAVVLSNRPSVDIMPRILFNGSHHGVELLATDFSFDVLEELCESTDPEARKRYDAVLDKAEVWVIPTVNLDGNDIFFHVSEHLGRKNARGVFARAPYTVSPWPRKIGPYNPDEAYYRYRPNDVAAGAGVDINRNYPLYFGAGGRKSSSGHPRNYWYRGKYAASEPEVQSMMNLFHVNQFVGSISFHTAATRILSPYSINDLQNPPHEEDPAWQLGDQMAQAAGYQPSRKSYKVVKNLYAVDGTDQDWFRMISATMAYLIEGPLHNPSGQKRTQSIIKSRPAWQTFYDAMTHATIIRVHDTNGYPLIAEVTYSDVPQLNHEHWLTRCKDGTHVMYCTQPREITVTLLNGDTQTKTADCTDTPYVIDFTFERPNDYSLEKAFCASGICDTLTSVDTLCALKNNICPSLPAQNYCYIDNECIPAGTVRDTNVSITRICDPREDNRHWSLY